MNVKPSASRPAVLFLGSQMETGGAQRVLLDQADWFHHQGYPVTVVFMYDKEHLQQRWQQQYPFPILSLAARDPQANALSNLWALLRGTFRLFDLLRRGHFDAIETFTHHSNLIGIPLAWLAGVPVRLASHHGRILRFPGWLERLHTFLMNSSLTTRLVAVSEGVYQQALQQGIRPDKMRVIPNGVLLPEVSPDEIAQLRSSLGMSAEDALVLTVGRLTYQKAHTFFLQAAAQILKVHPHTCFCITGDGSLRAELEAETHELGIEPQVRFLGIRRDVPQLMAAADVFVISSRSEGMPMVLLEAMGQGAAVVSTQVPGVEQVIEAGENGLIVPAEDAHALALAVIDCLEHPEKRHQLGAAARRSIYQKYSSDRMCRNYAALLDPARSEEYGWR